MALHVVFETHSTTEDNERGIATGWLQGQLSEIGRMQAVELGQRRRDDDIAAVFCSDLRRAAETASIAFAGTTTPLLLDWRLRECDYGERNGMSALDLQEGRLAHLDQAYPGGESWRQAVARVGGFLADFAQTRWASARVLVVGHIATRWAFEHLVAGVPLERLAVENFVWQPGWEYRIT